MNLLLHLVSMLALDAFALGQLPPDVVLPDTCSQSRHAAGFACDDPGLRGPSQRPLNVLSPDAAAGSHSAHEVMFIGEDDRQRIPDEQASSDYPFVGAWFTKTGARAAMQFAGNATAVHPRVVVMTSHQLTAPDSPRKSLFNKSGGLKNAAHSTWVLFAGCDEPVKVEKFSEVGWFLGQANSPMNDYAVAILTESCLRRDQVARPASLNGVDFARVHGRPLEMVSRVPSHSLLIPGTDYQTYLGRDVFVFLKSIGKVTQRFQDEHGQIRVLIHDLDADHGHSGSGILLTDQDRSKRFIGVLSGSVAGRDPVSLKTEFTNSVAFAGALQAAVTKAIAEVEGI